MSKNNKSSKGLLLIRTVGLKSYTINTMINFVIHSTNLNAFCKLNIILSTMLLDIIHQKTWSLPSRTCM